MEFSSLDDFKRIDIHDLFVFKRYFNEYQPEISEYTFTNLYMWRDHYQFRWCEQEGTLCIISAEDTKNIIVFPPIGKNPVELVRKLKNFSNAQDLTMEFHRIPESLANMVEKADIGLEKSEDRPNWDYVYLRNDLVDLPGKDYANERKKLNKFKRENKWRYEPLNDTMIDECLKLQEEWCDLRSCEDDPSLQDEDHAIKDILDQWKTLQFEGGLIMVGQKIVAFSLGETLNDETFVVHIEKANYDYKGAYEIINQQFAENAATPLEFINREQDLGIKGLRRAKQRYHPKKMTKKFIMKCL